MKYFGIYLVYDRKMSTNAMTMNILEIVNSYIKKYNKLIDEEFGISQTELLTLWESMVNGTNEVPTSTKSSPTKSSPTKSSPTKSSPTKTNVSGCPYIFTKGAKEGQQCGCKPKGGKTYCSRHKKYEGCPPNSKKVLPPPRRSIVSTVKKPTYKKKSQEIVLHKGPEGRLYHRPTGLVFNKERVAIGTWLRACDNPEEVDKVIPLTDDDIKKAKQHMFAFKKEETDHILAATRKVTRMLEPSDAKKLQESLSGAINDTNLKAKDVNDILCELQVRGSNSELISEDISDESEYEEEELEEELEEED